MNKKIFASSQSIPATNTANEAGGRAYSLSDEASLAQLAVTGCLNNTFYASAENQLKQIKDLAGKCGDEFLAKVAVYAHSEGRMKDAPALILGILIGRRSQYIESVFNKVITNQKMLRNLVQVIRSGELGYKSLGTKTKNLIQKWLSSKTSDELFYGSVGQSPSLGDVVKLAHPKPELKQKEAFYGWLLGKEYNQRNLPAQVKLFEKFKKGETSEIPKCDFRMLTALPLTNEVWTDVGLKMPWNALRMNINTLNRHGVFANKNVVKTIANKLSSEEEVRRSNAFPYQLMTTYQNIEDNTPMEIKLALQQAMEYATSNVPQLDGDTVVLVDVSGSMQSPITGTRVGATTKTKCVDVAALIAASLLRKNPTTRVVLFDTAANEVSLNPLDSVMTNATRLNRNGGGTDCAVGLDYLLKQGLTPDNVIMVSDNESWVQQHRAHYSSSMARNWKALLNKNRKARLVCLDIQPYASTQVMDSTSVMNVAGFNDSVFSIIESFFNRDVKNFVEVINQTQL